MSLDQFTKIYLDYVNNFLSIQAFADHYGITEAEAAEIVKIGCIIGSLDIDFGHTDR